MRVEIKTVVTVREPPPVAPRMSGLALAEHLAAKRDPAVVAGFVTEDASVVDTAPCCDDMRKALREYVHVTPDDRAVVALGSYRYDEPDYKAIAYCPWCATPIEVVEVERVCRVAREVTETRPTTKTVYDETPETPRGLLTRRSSAGST